MRTAWSIFCLALLCVCVPQAAAHANDAKHLFNSVNARLSLMKPVAAWKLDKDIAVEDLAREKVVLSKAAASAEELGINANSTQAFFQAQIEAAKEIQRCWIKRWQSGTAPRMTKYPDLKDEIRPKLIELGGEILASFKTVLSDTTQIAQASQQTFAQILDVECLSPKTAQSIFQAMRAVRLTGQ